MQETPVLNDLDLNDPSVPTDVDFDVDACFWPKIEYPY